MSENVKDKVLEVKVKVLEIIARHADLSVDEISEDDSLRDGKLNFDSLTLVEMVIALEEELKCKIPDGEMEGLSSVKDVISYVASKVS